MKSLVALVSISAVLWGGSGWAGGGGDEDTFKDDIRAMQERIKQLEDEVRQLRAAQQPPPAQAATPDLGPFEQRLKTLEDSFSPLQGLEVGGMVYGSYNYNFNNPDSKDNSLRIFDTRANNFTLDLAQLTIAKKEREGIGFTVKLDYGRTARLIQSDWNGNGSFSNSTDNFELQEAYITYTAGIGKGLGVKAGKFVTLLGAEVIESPLNYNVSRSFMFGLAIPFTHTGLLLSYPFHDMVSLTAGIVNGWDNVLDSNKGKTFLGSLAFTPMESLIWTFNGTFGAEQPERGGSKRGVFDTVLTYKPIPNLDLVLNYDYGTESDLLVDGDDAIWQGVAGIISIGGALVSPEWEAFSLSQRLEWFSDEDGVRTGTDQDLWEATTTAKWKITERLMARVEYRHDESNKRVFSQKLLRREVDTSVFRFLHGQDTLSAELAFVY